MHLKRETTISTTEEQKTEVLPVADQAPASDGPTTEKPKLADGVELIGEYEGSGFKEAPYIARRSDGQVVQLAPLLYMIAEAADGQRTNEEIAAAVSEAIKRGVSADNVRQLVDERLRPLGVIASANGTQEPELQKLDPMLALKLKAALVPERVVNAITTVFKPLFFPPVILAVIAGLIALDVWLFAYHGVAQSLREVLYSPALLMLMLGLVILSAAFHECGHATACAYGGARPGAMGAGLYIVWPAFYTDVTDAYRLGKGGRLRTDLGGVYFNVIFILATAGAYAVTGYEPLLLIIPLQHFEIMHQFLPFIRLDGYYIVSDLTGVPDMFARIKPTLASLLPWKKASDRVTELKPWVRVAVTIYVLTVVPLLLFMFGLMVINTPRIFSTAYDSFLVQYHKVQHAFDGGSALTGAIGIFQMLILVLPAIGIVATFWMVLRRISGAAWGRTEGHPAARGALVLAAGAAATFLGYVWWPNGDYRPIQPGEKGTIQGAVRQFAAVPTGRPALTQKRETALGGAPLLSDEQNITKPPTNVVTNQTETQTTQTVTDPSATVTTPTTTVEETVSTTTTPTTTTTTTTTATTTTPTP
ncbi:MAG: putative peptide zinc metalloprotease protein [Gaiellaceae bacterium]|nr:putative peptide zinc metalloprotease protein [Gaiellaceae bacterium]